MPRPLAVEPKKEIDALLAELVDRVSAVFDRLLQENLTLSQELKLGSFAAPCDPTQQPYSANRFAKSLEVRELPEQHSAWRISTDTEVESIHAVSATVFRPGSDAAGLCARSSSASTSKIAPSNSNLDTNANSGSQSRVQSNQLLELFQRLDVEGRGELTFENLVSLLTRHRQPCEYVDLVNLVRWCNRLEPLDLIGVDADKDTEAERLAEAARSECLTIDFPAFAAVMRAGKGTDASTGMGVGVDVGMDDGVDSSRPQIRALARPQAQAEEEAGLELACLQSLRTACQKEVQAQGHGLLVQWSASAAWSSQGQAQSQSQGQGQVQVPGRAGGSVTSVPKLSKSRSGEQAFSIDPTVFWLEIVPTCVILLNMIVTGLSIDYPEEEVAWDICEGFFVAFYIVESVAKMRFFGCHGYFWGRERWWNWFDFLCLQISCVDTVVKICLSLFMEDKSTDALRHLLLTKVFRLARLARLVRTLRFKIFYELKLMVMGVFSGLRVLSWAVVLLIFLAYPLGVGMTSMLDRKVDEFASVLDSMFTLFRCWTDGCSALDGTPLPELLYREHGPFFMLFHILMTMFVTVGLFNLIMAIFIDNVVNTQALRKAKEMAERSQEFEQRFKKLFTSFLHHGIKERNETFWERMYRLVRELRERDSGFRKTVMCKISNDWENLRNTHISISKDMFAQWLEQEDFKQLLEDADIETTSHAELFDVLDADMGGELSMDELTTGLMRLRGPVSKADIAAVRLKVSFLTRALDNLVARISGGQKLS